MRLSVVGLVRLLPLVACLSALHACRTAHLREQLPGAGTLWTPCIRSLIRAPANTHDRLSDPLYDFPTADWGLAAISQRVPGGFAGFWLAPSQQLQMGLVDTSQAAQARRALLAFLPPPAEGRVSAINAESVVAAAAVKVRWSYAELYDWHIAFTARAKSFGLELDGLAIYSVDPMRNRLFYAAADSLSFARLRAFLNSQSIPCGLVATARVIQRAD